MREQPLTNSTFGTKDRQTDGTCTLYRDGAEVISALVSELKWAGWWSPQSGSIGALQAEPLNCIRDRGAQGGSLCG